jgi:hypothetical protein
LRFIEAACLASVVRQDFLGPSLEPSRQLTGCMPPKEFRRLFDVASTLAADATAGAMLGKEFRRLFGIASSLRDNDRERQVSDQVLVQWISKQVELRGLTAAAKLLDYDAANLAKVLAGRRAPPARIRKRVNESIGERT